jgi:hypothetical protein
MSDHVTGPKPFQIAPEHAARLIRDGLARGRSVIAFPFLLHLGTRLLTVLPGVLADRIWASIKVDIRRPE